MPNAKLLRYIFQILDVPEQHRRRGPPLQPLETTSTLSLTVPTRWETPTPLQIYPIHRNQAEEERHNMFISTDPLIPTLGATSYDILIINSAADFGQQIGQLPQHSTLNGWGLIPDIRHPLLLRKEIRNIFQMHFWALHPLVALQNLGHSLASSGEMRAWASQQPPRHVYLRLGGFEHWNQPTVHLSEVVNQINHLAQCLNELLIYNQHVRVILIQPITPSAKEHFTLLCHSLTSTSYPGIIRNWKRVAVFPTQAITNHIRRFVRRPVFGHSEVTGDITGALTPQFALPLAEQLHQMTVLWHCEVLQMGPPHFSGLQTGPDTLPTVTRWTM